MYVFESGSNITELFNRKLESIKRKLNEYDYKQLRDFSEDEIQAISNMGYVENIVVDFDNPVYKPSRGTMRVFNQFRSFEFEKQYFDVDSLDIFVMIPILANVDIVNYCGNPNTITFSYTSVNMELRRENDVHYLTFSMQFRLSEISSLSPEQQLEKTQKEYKEHIQRTRFYYEQLRKEIESFNTALLSKTKKYIKEKIEKDTVLDIFSKAIGVVVEPKDADREKGKKIRVSPKRIQQKLPDKKIYDEYYFDNANYNAILQTIREHLVATEVLPKPIQKLDDEELIRDTILWALNANYIVATGETFRAAGKTDINVNIDNKSAFIAECKVWHGPKTFSEALNQVYAYTTWRDCRIAILIFNLKYKDFGQVLTKLEQQIATNENYISMKKKSDNEWECKFKSATDSNGQITINVLASDYCLRK